MRKLFLFFAALILYQSLKSQPLSDSYFPFKVGNIYIYEKRSVSIGNPAVYELKKFSIPYDTIAYGKHYYFNTFHGAYVRFDSINNNLFQFQLGRNCNNLNNEIILDSLNVQLDSSANSCSMTYRHFCSQKGNISFFNRTVEGISFRYSYAPVTVTNQYAKGLGTIVNDFNASLITSTTYTLKACKIGDYQYGDSTLFYLLEVSQTSSDIPVSYSLSQNYPNPFNPSTKINYDIKSSSFVSMKVFDLLGKEVASLVNEKQNAGSYAVDFNSAEYNLPSGIYFYTLNAGEFKDTRKMVLVK